MKLILYALSAMNFVISFILAYTALTNNTSFLNGRDATMALFFAVIALYLQVAGNNAEPKA